MAVSKRFEHVNEEEFNTRTEQLVPLSTRKKVTWVLNMFKAFEEEELRKQSANECERLLVYKNIEEMTLTELNNELKYFFLSVRRQDGERYPPKTIYDIMTMLNFYLNNDLKKKINMFQDDIFKESVKAMNTAMKESARCGLVSGVLASRPISIEDENTLWEAGVLGWNSPKQTLNTAVFLLSIHTSVRGGKELRSWTYGENSPFRFDCRQGKEVLVYCETHGKTYQGTASSMRLDPPKECIIHHNDENHERCAVCAFKKIIDGRPIKCSKNSLFLKPLAHKKGNVLFGDQVVGEHTLGNIISTVMAGIPGRYTNHSTRKTAPTRLYHGKIEEQIIQEQTRHRSLVVRKYKETSDEQLREKSSVIYGNKRDDHGDLSDICITESKAKKMRVDIDGEKNSVRISFD